MLNYLRLEVKAWWTSRTSHVSKIRPWSLDLFWGRPKGKRSGGEEPEDTFCTASLGRKHSYIVLITAFCTKQPPNSGLSAEQMQCQAVRGTNVGCPASEAMQSLLTVCTPLLLQSSSYLCKPFATRRFSVRPGGALLPHLTPSEDQDTTTTSGLLIQLHVEKLIELQVTEGKVIEPLC